MSAALLDAELIADSPAPSDAELIERFVTARDHEAFAQLVYRHGTIVLGVSRRVLNEAHDIEDVFQATFLVLIRDAARIRNRRSIASWLYGVAYRLALRVARQKQRRREIVLVDVAETDDATFQELADRHDQQIVDAELNALPDRYRQVLVLRFVSGKSPFEIASDLGITINAVDGLLKRGKNELRTRLLQRGMTLGAALAVVQFTQQAAQATDLVSLYETAIQTGLAWDACSNILSTDLVSSRAAELAAKEGITMTLATKASWTMGLTLGAIIAGYGASGLMNGRQGGHVEAGGIVTTMPVSSAVRDGISLASVAIDPNDKKVEAGSNSGPPRGATKPVASEPETTGANRDEKNVATEGYAKSNKPDDGKSSLWDFKLRNPNVARIERALQQTTEVNFREVPLQDAVDYLKDYHQVDILTDKKSLTENGFSMDSTVNLAVSGVSLKSTLRLLLEPVGLDYVIQNDVMVITMREKADETFETRVYRTSRLTNLTPKELVEIITSSVEPDRWTASSPHPADGATQLPAESPVEAGSLGRPAGSGVAGPAPGTAGGDVGGPPKGSARATRNTLVIRQTQRIHDEIVDLLSQLEQQAAEAPDSPVRTETKPRF